MNLRVLFIGNSHTYLNYMPLMLMEMVEASGRGLKLETEQSIGESVSLEWHWKNPRTRELMAARGWDFVVLQDRSGGPLENRPSFERYARLLDGEIRRQGGASIFYMTWSRKSQPQTQAELNDAYTSIARELGAMLAPVSKEEGGRHTPFFPGYRPQFYFRTTDVTGSCVLPEGTEMVMPGDNIGMTVTLLRRSRWRRGCALPYGRAAAPWV